MRNEYVQRWPGLISNHSEEEPKPQSGRRNPLRRFDIKYLADLLFEHMNEGAADISVVIPLYNYQDYIEECLESVINQNISKLSIVIIDDNSSDRGADIAIEILKSCSERFVNCRVIRHRRNQGLAMTRNSGIVWSAEPYLFMLDADNILRRPALSRLLEALLTSNREFAYSQLHMIGNASDVVGVADVWDPQRFQYCNYIDGMALIRRIALTSVGGYHVSAVQEGWEDFDLWCRFAELGYRGVFLPELLCQYRVHSASMVHTRTNYQRRSLSLEMVLRHPRVFGNGCIPPFVDYFPPDSE